MSEPTIESLRELQAILDKCPAKASRLIEMAQQPQFKKDISELYKISADLMDHMHAVAMRRERLAANMPTCSCGSKQVQLVTWFDDVKWRCRECRLIIEPKELNE